MNIAPDRVYLNEPLSKHTTFGIGAAADLFILPNKNSQIKQLININLVIIPASLAVSTYLVTKLNIFDFSNSNSTLQSK